MEKLNTDFGRVIEYDSKCYIYTDDTRDDDTCYLLWKGQVYEPLSVFLGRYLSLEINSSWIADNDIYITPKNNSIGKLAAANIGMLSCDSEIKVNMMYCDCGEEYPNLQIILKNVLK